MLQMIKHALFAGTLSAVGALIFYLLISAATRRDIGYRPAIAAVVMPVIAFLSPHIAIVQLMMFLLVPLCARTRRDILPIFIIGLLLLPGLGKPLVVGSLYLFALNTPLLLSLGALLTMAIKPGRTTPGKWWTHIPFVIVCILVWLVAARDQTATNMLRQVLMVAMSMVPPYLVVAWLIRSAEDARRMLLAMVMAGTICSVILAFEAVRFWPIYVELVMRFDVGGALVSHLSVRGGMLRAAGPMMQSTMMAFVLCFCFLAGYLMRRSFPSLPHWLAMMAVLAVGLIAPQSRNAWLGVATGLLMLEIYRGRAARMGALVAIGAVVAGLLAVAVSSSPRLAEAVGVSGEASNTGDYRERLLRRGMEEFRKAPLFGAAPEIVNRRLEDMVQGEGIVDYVNSYLYFALFTGGLGLAVFVFGQLFELATLWFRRRRWRSEPMMLDIGAYAFGAIVMMAQMLIFTSFVGMNATMSMMCYALVAGLVACRPTVAGAASRPRRRPLEGMVMGPLPTLQR
ncbi:O-Antigen ligase [Sphingomonas laterariae]|uniref:O-Antigen ligase n=1 Tax=Edaphosphingomonas laterariae TaxID=861865 RepID=A0A239HQN2_9SPHN|nr:O-antigen ligase family protein [Sphingomonas laterariae]SNS83596.1 O-Antigen ligase [Sphingomonas laterariae]